jgi:hypothetical protein
MARRRVVLLEDWLADLECRVADPGARSHTCW